MNIKGFSKSLVHFRIHEKHNGMLSKAMLGFIHKASESDARKQLCIVSKRIGDKMTTVSLTIANTIT